MNEFCMKHVKYKMHPVLSMSKAFAQLAPSDVSRDDVLQRLTLGISKLLNVIKGSYESITSHCLVDVMRSNKYAYVVMVM
jgi:hypothetical protein